MTEIIFVRHAESMTNAGSLWPDAYSIPLSEKGQAQAKRLVDRLPDAEVVLYSGMARTKLTIDPYLASRPHVRSMYLGDLNEMRDLCWEKVDVLDRTAIRAAFERWWSDPDPHEAHGGEEHYANMAARANRVIASLAHCSFERVIVVSHANYLRLLHCFLLGKLTGSLSEQKLAYYGYRKEIYVGNAGISRCTVTDGTWTVGPFEHEAA